MDRSSAPSGPDPTSVAPLTSPLSTLIPTSSTVAGNNPGFLTSLRSENDALLKKARGYKETIERLQASMAELKAENETLAGKVIRFEGEKLEEVRKGPLFGRFVVFSN